MKSWGYSVWVKNKSQLNVCHFNYGRWLLLLLFLLNAWFEVRKKKSYSISLACIYKWSTRYEFIGSCVIWNWDIKKSNETYIRTQHTYSVWGVFFLSTSDKITKIYWLNNLFKANGLVSTSAVRARVEFCFYDIACNFVLKALVCIEHKLSWTWTCVHGVMINKNWFKHLKKVFQSAKLKFRNISFSLLEL